METKQHRNILETKWFGRLLFVEAERNPDGSSAKETYVYAPDGKYLTLIKAYWWDKDGIAKALANERTEDIIYEKLGTHKQSVSEKVQTAVEAITKLNDEELDKEAEALLEKVKYQIKKTKQYV